jgi:hypothetical protein
VEQVNVGVAWVYHEQQDQAAHIGDYWEGVLSPRYTLAYETPIHSWVGRGGVGFWHNIGIGHGIDIGSKTYNLSADVGYWDGLNNERGLGHVQFGVSTGFKLSEHCTILPDVYYLCGQSIQEESFLYGVPSTTFKY